MYYETSEDMDTFVEFIKDFYSINDFDDDDFALIIVDCGRDGTAAKRLHALTLKAKCSSLIQAEYVLPFIAAAKRAIKKGDEFAVSVLDAAYTICVDENAHADCACSDSEPENALILETSDFITLFSADTSVFGRDEEALKQKDAQIEKMRTEYERELTNAQKKAAEERSEHQRQLAETESRKDAKILELQTEYERKLESEIDRVLTNSVVCVTKHAAASGGYFSEYEKNGLTNPYNGFLHILNQIGSSAYAASKESSGYYRLRWELQRGCEHGALVEEGQCIAHLTGFEGKATVRSSSTYNIFAPCSGKIFYLKVVEHNFGDRTPFAIITPPPPPRNSERVEGERQVNSDMGDADYAAEEQNIAVVVAVSTAMFLRGNMNN
ncbi:MAG: hypothetical protein ACTTKL_00980 [Treponema sp.]